MSHPSRLFQGRNWRKVIASLLAVLCLSGFNDAPPGEAPEPSPNGPDFVAFESGHVRPLALSPDGRTLFAVNTPNATLEIFDVTKDGLSLRSRVPVGLEPVAVAPRNDDEVWVVNHLSDSVSVVSLDGTPRVTRTLLVGDAPRDIVFAGENNYAFVTTAHRGQHRTHPSLADVPGAGDPQFTTPSVGRADVWVFNPTKLGATLGGKPKRIMSFFADTPRALAVSPDKETVYVAAFKSGNQTTTVIEDIVCDGFKPHEPCTIEGEEMPGGLPGPSTNEEGLQAPETGLIVKYNNETQQWEDNLGRDWSDAVAFNLPDLDVFAVDADELTETRSYPHVGTTLFNMTTNPRTGELYVSNTEAFNHIRFEGSGDYGGSTVQGHIAESRVTLISDSQVQPRHLNKHLDYSTLAGDPGFDPTAKDHSLSTPLGMTVSGDGETLYVAAFGSGKIGVFDTGGLKRNSFNPRQASADYIEVSGGGPSDMVLDEARGRMYVMTRFDNAVKVVDLESKDEIGQAAMPNPEPDSVVEGRPMLYDATSLSAHGESSCASCHIFGDKDELAWDLGNPEGQVTENPLEKKLSTPIEIITGKQIFNIDSPMNGTGRIHQFHPMKGPMTTQTLRGLSNSGAMHWRGDRAVGHFGTDANDEELSFNNFIVAFEELLGASSLPPEADMQAFTDFQLQVMMPPNPVRNLDNSLTPSQQRGFEFFTGDRPSDGQTPVLGRVALGHQTAFNCQECHRLDPAEGFFGTNGEATFDGIHRIMKIPQLRNMYDKVGMFGMPKVQFFRQEDPGFMGDQIRGFGFIHDGTVDTMFRFFTAQVFTPNPRVGFPRENTDQTRRDVVDYMLAFDTDLAPIVGQQITLTSDNAEAANPRIDLLMERAGTDFVSKELGGEVHECDLVARVARDGNYAGYLYNPSTGNFVTAGGARSVPISRLRNLAQNEGQEVTFTCAPPGSGPRMALGL